VFCISGFDLYLIRIIFAPMLFAELEFAAVLPNPLKSLLMRNYLALIVFVVSLASCSKAKVRQHVISEYEVAKHLNENYDPAQLSDGLFYRLAKKRGGWFVQQYKYDSKTSVNTVLKEEQCWSAESHSFLPVTLLGPKSKAAYAYFRANKHYNTSDHSPYFGYEGWAEDVIADFEGTEEDTTLEGLGRAYQAYGDGFLLNLAGFNNPENYKKQLDERIKRYTENTDKAIAVFTKLREVNPNYSMLVGQPQTKLANTYMAAWVNLTVIGKPDLAAKYIVPDLYDPLMLSFARSMLNNCPQNALLFTHGDNDTYPLYYLQQRDKIRPDVEVINLSLLNSPDVIKWHQKDRKLMMSIDASVYSKNVLEQIFLEDNDVQTDSVSWADFVAQLNAKIPGADENNPVIVKKVQVVLPYTAGRDLNIPDSLRGDIRFKFNNKYMLLGDLALADIVANNLNTRPVCVTGSSYSVPSLLSYQFIQRGGHNRLIPESYYHSMENGVTQYPVDAVCFTDFYTKKSRFDTLCTDRQAGTYFVQMMRYDFSDMAMLLAKTDNVKFQELMAWHDKTFSRKSWPYTTQLAIYVKALLQANQTEKAKQVTAQIIEDEQTGIKKSKGDDTDSSRQTLVAFCYTIADFAKQYQQDEWAEQMQQEAKRIESEGKKK
jgi:hypothetical protein